MTEPNENRPSFEGLVLEQNTERQFYYWYPKGWHRYDLSDGRTGVLCSPCAQDPTTYFSVQVQELPTAIHPQDDLDTLREGIHEGLAQLPDLHVESSEESYGENRITFERVFTFRDRDVTRKRRIRLLYVGARLYSLISQGSTENEYTRYLSMLNYCHLTFQLGLFDPAQLG